MFLSFRGKLYYSHSLSTYIYTHSHIICIYIYIQTRILYIVYIYVYYIYIYVYIYQHHQRGANSIPESKGPKGVPIWHPYRSSCLYNDVWAHICVSSPLITGFSPSSLCAGHTATGCRGLLSFPHRGAKWSGCGMVVCYPFIHRQQT